MGENKYILQELIRVQRRIVSLEIDNYFDLFLNFFQVN